jgi:RNA polymerase sigma-70 factor (ECF subfamily)
MGPNVSCRADEFTLVERAKSDPEAFGELYERHFDGIYAFAYARLNTRTEAEDATSEVFFKALRGIRGYRRTDKPFRAWLYRIAANVIIDRRRRQRPTTALEESVEAAIESPDVADTSWSASEGVQSGRRLTVSRDTNELLSRCASAPISRTEASPL